MKRIILMRHGKSSWDYQVADKDRPLKERGINDAHLVAEEFKKKNVQIDFAFSSHANRALHTSIIFLRNIGFSFEKLQVTQELYDFSGGNVQNFVESLDNQYETISLFGHNYAFTSLANTWGDQYIDNVPTAGLVQIKFDTDDWAEISKGTTEQIIFPKHLKG
ncbi:MAG: histidine phosphatase family protein [Allomuricauda sp.]